jgi:PknH-like extracellular domain
VTYIGTATRACGVCAVIAASVLLTACASTVSGNATRAQNAGPVDAPPLNESKLPDLLLSIGEINTIMGSRTMEVTGELAEMTDRSADVSDADCLSAIYGAEEPVYAGSGWTAVLDQVAREDTEDNDHWVEQTVVLYPSADKAQKFFDDSKSTWQDCANYAVSVDDDGTSYVWQLEDVTVEDTIVTQFITQDDARGWGCQHALSPASNVIIEVWACSYNVGDEAVNIATGIVANAARK